MAPSPVSETASSEDSADFEMPALQFPEENFWNVLIMVANSSIEIWLRILGDEYSVRIYFVIIILYIYRCSPFV